MTLPTGAAPSRVERRAGAAFTLIELILVMALLTVVTSLAAPQLARFFKGRGLDSEARRFLSLTRYAQSRATGEGVPMVLWMDEKERRYGLTRQSGFERREDESAVEYELGKDVVMEVERLGRSGFQAPVSRSSRESARPLMGLLPAMVFTPDGFIAMSSPESVVFREGENSEVRIGLTRSSLSYEIQTNQMQRIRLRR